MATNPNLDSYFDALISPNNLPNVILAAVGIVGIIVAINTLIWLKRQTVAIRKQAEIMDKQATDAKAASEQQVKDVQASIAEAVRSAGAMERVADSTAVNAASVRESVGITREIADMQKKAIELGGRAYLSVSFESATYQDANNFFEARATIKNHGNTPAYDVRFKAVAAIISDPIPADFDYSLPTESAGNSASLLWPQATKSFFRLVSDKVPDEDVEPIKFGGPKWLALWGIIYYRDAFDVERSTKFAFTVRWLPVIPGAKDTNGNPLQRPLMSYDTTRHNEAN